MKYFILYLIDKIYNKYPKVIQISFFEYNYSHKNKRYLFDTNKIWCGKFREGFACIKDTDFRYNIINTNGKYLLKNNIDYCYSFYIGFSIVKINNNTFLIDTKCNFYNYHNRISFKELYKEYPNMRTELIEIISKYTYHNIDEYFNL